MKKAAGVAGVISLLLAFSVTGTTSIAEGFFDPPPDESANYDPNEIYPNGQIYPLSFYSLLQRDMGIAKESDVPIVGPYYGGVSAANLAAQDQATATGLHFIHQIEPPGVTFQDSNPNRLTVLDTAKKAELRSQIQVQMASTLNVPIRNANLYAWSLTPEELRPFRSVEMEYLRFVADTIRTIDREHGNKARPVLLYNPNHRLTSQLITLGEHLDILLKGAYVNSWPAGGGSVEAGRPRPWIRWAVDNIVTAAETLPHRPVPFVALEMSQDPRDVADRNPETIRRWVLHGAYLSLVRGTKGMLVWSGFRSRPSLTQTFDFWFDGYRSIATDLNGPLQLGKVFLFGQRRTDITASITRGTDTVSYQGSDGLPQTDSSLQLADIALGGARYLVVVNSADTSVTATFQGFPDAPVESLRLFDDHVESVQGSFEHALQPYEAVAWRFSPRR
jgi:hypothetical protein